MSRFQVSGFRCQRSLIAAGAWGIVLAASMTAHASTNRLIHETSPYLLQHARNPVDWYPWGPEAFERAKKEDKPIFLSIGYSSCHWCHVMEHESFENDDVARILNDHFVCIKVDREERQDIDEIYMTVTQIMTGRGGWPNSVWLLADGRPWFAGTYFPREDSQGRAGFKTLLLKLANFWNTRRDDVEKQADQLATAIRQSAALSGTGTEPVTAQSLRDIVTLTLGEAQRSYDAHHGGFGGAPKFPPHALLSLLLEEYEWTQDKLLLGMVTGTLDAMALGGIHDQIGGGFHRYATDERWFLPHFEKMLYDNAQLARVYAEAYRVTSNGVYAAVARDTCDWVLREMTGKEGGFYSALDADSEGVEGKFYVWTRDEIVEVLGKEDGAKFCAAYNVSAVGNYHEESTGKNTGSNIPFLSAAPETDFAAARAKLLAHRAKRIWPGLDDKVLTSWNGLMIGALARAGRILEEPRYLEAAQKAASFILSDMRKDGQLLRSYRAGSAKIPAYLDDCVFLANGLLDLHEATGDDRWKKEAAALMDTVVKQFADERGGFYYASVNHEQLLARTKDPFDQAVPSANAVAALVLLRLDQLDRAVGSLQAFMPLFQRAPTAASTFILAAARCADRMSKAGPALSVRRGPVRVDAAVTPTHSMPGETLDLAIKLTIDDGWHINAHEPADETLIPTSIEISTNANFVLKKVNYTKGSKPLKGGLVIGGKVGVSKTAPAGDTNLEVVISFQPCDETRCLKSEEVIFAVPVRIGISTTNPDSPKGRNE